MSKSELKVNKNKNLSSCTVAIHTGGRAQIIDISSGSLTALTSSSSRADRVLVQFSRALAKESHKHSQIVDHAHGAPEYVYGKESGVNKRDDSPAVVIESSALVFYLDHLLGAGVNPYNRTVERQPIKKEQHEPSLGNIIGLDWILPVFLKYGAPECSKCRVSGERIQLNTEAITKITCAKEGSVLLISALIPEEEIRKSQVTQADYLSFCEFERVIWRSKVFPVAELLSVLGSSADDLKRSVGSDESVIEIVEDSLPAPLSQGRMEQLLLGLYELINRRTDTMVLSICDGKSGNITSRFELYRGFRCPVCAAPLITTQEGSSDKSRILLNGITFDELRSGTVRELFDWLESLQVSRKDFTHIVGRRLAQLQANAAALRQVGFSNCRLATPLKQLSSGERLRFAIALLKVLDINDGVIFLPTFSEVFVREEMMELVPVLRELLLSGNTCIVLTQDQLLLDSCGTAVDIANFYAEDEDLICDAAEIQPRQPIHKNEHAQLILAGLSEIGWRTNTVSFQLGSMVRIRGRSGTGKTRLIQDLLPAAINGGEQCYATVNGQPARMFISAVHYLSSAQYVPCSEFIARYCGLFAPITELLSGTLEARLGGVVDSDFSFAKSNPYLCKMCALQTHALTGDDLHSKCLECSGARFSGRPLLALFRGKNLADILALTVRQALELFWDRTKLAAPLRGLEALGLSQLQLGAQVAALTSGQRLLLETARALSAMRNAGKSKSKAAQVQVFAFDFPFVGLERPWQQRLFTELRSLTTLGHLVICVDNTDNSGRSYDEVISLD